MPAKASPAAAPIRCEPDEARAERSGTAEAIATRAEATPPTDAAMTYTQPFTIHLPSERCGDGGGVERRVIGKVFRRLLPRCLLLRTGGF